MDDASGGLGPPSARTTGARMAGFAPRLSSRNPRAVHCCLNCVSNVLEPKNAMRSAPISAAAARS